MKRYLIVLIALLSFTTIESQTLEPNDYSPKSFNKIYLELGGQYFCSLNYERNVETNSAWFPSWKVGVSYGPFFVFPLGIDANKRISERKQFTLGLGVAVIIGYDPFGAIFSPNSRFPNLATSSDYWYSIKFGYQYSKPSSKWFFGGSLNPIFYRQEAFWGGEFVLVPVAGLHIGSYL